VKQFAMIVAAVIVAAVILGVLSGGRGRGRR